MLLILCFKVKDNNYNVNRHITLMYSTREIDDSSLNVIIMLTLKVKGKQRTSLNSFLRLWIYDQVKLLFGTIAM